MFSQNIAIPKKIKLVQIIYSKGSFGDKSLD